MLISAMQIVDSWSNPQSIFGALEAARTYITEHLFTCEVDGTRTKKIYHGYGSLFPREYREGNKS